MLDLSNGCSLNTYKNLFQVGMGQKIRRSENLMNSIRFDSKNRISDPIFLSGEDEGRIPAKNGYGYGSEK